MPCTSSPLVYLAAFTIAFAAGRVTAIALSKRSDRLIAKTNTLQAF
jgi:hypothetical protein